MSDLGLEAVEDALVLCGLFEGYPLQRRALAGTLVARAVAARDIELLQDWAMRAFTRSKRLAGLRNVLEDANRCPEVLADVREMADRREDARMGRKFSHPAEPEATAAEKEAWDEADRAVAVACRVDADHRELEEVAAEFNLTLGMAQHLLAKGRLTRQDQRLPAPEALPVPETNETHKERLDEFRRLMADKRPRESS